MNKPKNFQIFAWDDKAEVLRTYYVRDFHLEGALERFSTLIEHDEHLETVAVIDEQKLMDENTCLNSPF